MSAPDNERSVALWTIYTVWIRWTDEDAEELAGAVDEFTMDANPDAYQEILDSARERVGAENVREVEIAVPAQPIIDTFKATKVQAWRLYAGAR